MSKQVILLGVLLIGLCSWVAVPHRPILPRINFLDVHLDSIPNQGKPGTFGFGKPATVTHLSALDIDVRPDGLGLPAGSGTVAKGQLIFAAKCAACHGTGGTGGAQGALVVTLPVSGKRMVPVIGNYWPYASTIFDYIRRAMPFSEPGTLTNDEVYALTAFLLNANKIVDENFILNAQTLPMVKMPAQHLFVPDDRRSGPEIR